MFIKRFIRLKQQLKLECETFRRNLNTHVFHSTPVNTSKPSHQKDAYHRHTDHTHAHLYLPVNKPTPNLKTPSSVLCVFGLRNLV